MYSEADLTGVPVKEKGVEGQTPLMTVAMCVWAEARGESWEAKLGVAHVIMNRVLHPGWWGKDPKGVVLKKWQFSSFNQDDPNRAKMIDPLKWDTREVWNACKEAARQVFVMGHADNTGGADSYFDDSLANDMPEWATPDKKTVEIGRLNFYKVR